MTTMEPSRPFEEDCSQRREIERAGACERNASRHRLGLVTAFLVMLGLSGAFVWFLAISESVWTVEFHCHLRLYSLQRLQKMSGHDIRTRTEIHFGPFALSATHNAQKLASSASTAKQPGRSEVIIIAD